ncbi:MAG: FAD-binding oxidoreductase [Acidobacteria bacterium]|nr:FAD-binding oxidoreductase [Acidobacteriota bacterium]
MPTRYGVSGWIHQFPSSKVPSFPRFRGECTADVVVIGAGLTGCAAAHACAAAGLTTILLERGRVGQGRTGRSAGMLSPDPGPAFRDIAAAHGLASARRVFEAWRRGALDGAALLRRLRIPCALDPREALVVAGAADERLLRREYDARHAAGLDGAWLTRPQMHSRLKAEAAAALRLRDAFAFDPYRACLGLARAAVRRGTACFERSPVTRVRFTRRFADVITGGGRIRARKVIVATGSATPEFKSLQRHLDPREAYVVVTECMPAAMRRELAHPRVILRDLRVPPTRVSRTHDDRLVIAGGDQPETPPRTKATAIVQRTGQLMYEVLKTYPAILGLRPAYSWDTAYGETADGLMYIGAHRNYPHHLFAIGGGAHSVTGAFVAARILVRAVQDAPEKEDEVFGWTR